jgi:16S rRNA (cytidine1402-2'-O)-methyltransferase
MTSEQKKNTLYVIPTPISRQKKNISLPHHTIEVVHTLDSFVVEKVQAAQSFLEWCGHPKPIHEILFRVLNRKTPEHEAISFVNLLQQGNLGVISEAGMPGVADPGTILVQMAHQQGYRVVPLVGPSSIFLALSASGLSGQAFSFHGYLPRQDSHRNEKIQQLERESLKMNSTQIVMETPHRNMEMFSSLIGNLRRSTRLCIASGITSGEEWIRTKRVAEWRDAEKPQLQKVPALFLFQT